MTQLFFQAPPKEVPKTIENQRVYDETTVDPDDEEVNWYYLNGCSPFCLNVVLCVIYLYLNSNLQVAFDEGTDEFSSYFNKLTNPKVLITTSDRPRGVSCS